MARLAADAAGVLQARCKCLADEQAAEGIDDLDELALHALLADGLRRCGYAVQREVHYPADLDRPTTSRRRCDLLLSRLNFEDLDPLWLEIKRSWQFEEAEAHRGYSAQLMGNTVRDIRKLRADDGIHRAALLLIAFAADAATLAHDLTAFESTCSRKSALLPPREMSQFPIPDRIGHAVAATSCWRVV